MANRNLKNWNHSSIFKKFSASLTVLLFLASTNLTTAALANNQGGRGAAFEQFQLNNPGFDNKELKQMFKQELRDIKQGNNVQDVLNNIQSTQSIIHNNNFQQHLDKNDFASKAEFQAAKQALQFQNRNLNDTINQTVQQTSNNQIIKTNQGFALDLGSAVESITLGDKLFKTQESITINVGGQEKTLGAGSKVTAAEYVAARQALNTGSQTVTLDASGRASGGVVDLDAMTDGNRTMKVTDLVVPVSVTASGDFSKQGDIRIKGDLVNNGSINALASGNNKVHAMISAENITNNLGAEINSSVNELTLDADKAFANYGSINATENLTVAAGKSLTNTGSIVAQQHLNVFSPNVSNSGNIGSAQADVTFDAIASTMNINNNSGTVSALNGAINIREAGYNEAFDTNLVGGDLLSSEVNVNAGQGTANVNVDQLTGRVNATGLAAHINAKTDNLIVGKQCLIGDPTYYNTGNIILDGDIVVGEDLAIIAGGNITATSNLTQITARDAGGQGYNINIIAGANITGGTGEITPAGGPATLPAQSIGSYTENATGNVTISNSGAPGGNIDLSGAAAALSINSNSTATDASGRNISLAAFQNGATGGNIILPSGGSINAGGNGSGSNGTIRIYAPSSISVGDINSSSGSSGGYLYVYASNVGFSSGSSMIFNTAGQVTTGNNISDDGANPTGSIQLGNVSIAGNVYISAFGSIVTGDVTTTDPNGSQINIVNQFLGSTGTIATGNLTSSDLINVISNGAIDVQDINSQRYVSLDNNVTGSTSGISTGSIVVVDPSQYLNVYSKGAITVSGTINSSSIYLSNDSSGAAGGITVTGDITAPTGSVTLYSRGAISAKNIEAQSTINLFNNNSASYDTFVALDLTSHTGSVSVYSQGDISVANVDAENSIELYNAYGPSSGLISTGDLASHNGNISVYTYKSLTTQNVHASFSIILENDYSATAFDMITGNLTSDTLSVGLYSRGNYILGNISADSGLSVYNNYSGSISAGNVTIANGNANFYANSGTINLGDVDALNGLSFSAYGTGVSSVGNVTAQAGGVTIYAQSAGASVLNVGVVNANQDVSVSANTGSIQTSDLTSLSGYVTVGAPKTITVGNVSALSYVTLSNNTDGSSLTAGDVTSNGSYVSATSYGAINIQNIQSALYVNAQNYNASSDYDVSLGNVNSQFSYVYIYSHGALDVVSASAHDFVNIDNTYSATQRDINITGSVASLFSYAQVQSYGNITTGDISARNYIQVNNSSGTPGKFITTGALTSGQQSISVTSAGALTVQSSLAKQYINLQADTGALLSGTAESTASYVQLTNNSGSIQSDVLKGTSVTLTTGGTGDITAKTDAAAISVSSAGSVDVESVYAGLASLGSLTAGVGKDVSIRATDLLGQLDIGIVFSTDVNTLTFSAVAGLNLHPSISMSGNTQMLFSSSNGSIANQGGIIGMYGNGSVEFYAPSGTFTNQGGIILVLGTGALSITESGNIVDFGGGGITSASTTFNLTSTTGSIGTNLTHFSLSSVGGPSNFSVHAFNDAYVDTNSASMLASSAGGKLLVNSGSNLTVVGAVSGNDVDFTAYNVDLNAAISGTGSGSAISIHANNTLNVNAGGSVSADTMTMQGDSQVNWGGGNSVGGNLTIKSPIVVFNLTGGASIGSSGQAVVLDNGASLRTLQVTTTGDAHFDSQGSGTLQIGASSANEFNATASGPIDLTGDSTFDGDVNLTTSHLTNIWNTLTSNNGDINVQSLAGDALTITGGATLGTTGTWTATNGQINFTVGTGGNPLTMEGFNTFTTQANLYANQSGQSVVLASGSNSIAQVNSFIYTSNLDFSPGGILTTYSPTPSPTWQWINAGTYADNTTATFTPSISLVFFGADLAFIASGDIDLTGATISLNNTSGGNLTIIAGYDFSSSGTVPNFYPSTNFTAFSRVALGPNGGSILGNATINTFGTGGNGGSVTAVATGTIALGNIDTHGANGFAGGAVNLIAEGGITTGTIDTHATAGTSGAVTLAVAQASLSGGFHVQSGTAFGTISVGTASSGDIQTGAITANGAAVTVYGANQDADVVNLNAGVTADALTLNTVAGTVNANTTISDLNSINAGTTNASVFVSNAGALNLNTVTGANQSLSLSSTGAFTTSGAFAINGSFGAQGTSVDVTSGSSAGQSANLVSTAGSITGGINTGGTALTLDATGGSIGVGGSTRFTTNAGTMNVDATGSAFIDNTSATGVNFNSGTVSGTFDLKAANTVTTTTGNSITSGAVIITLTAGDIGTSGNSFGIDNGGSPMTLQVSTGAGDSFISHTGGGTLTLNASSGDDFTLTVSSAGAMATGADSTFDGNIDITTNSMTNAFHLTSTNGSINVRSNTGSGLTITGGPTPTLPGGQYEAQNGTINITATASDLLVFGVTTYLTDVNWNANGAGQGVILQTGSNSVANTQGLIFTAGFNGTNGTLTTFPGTWSIVSSGTFSQNPTGDLIVNGLNVAGGNIALLSANGIQLTGPIDLSGVTGGSLTMVAGFNYSPTGNFTFDVSNPFDTFTNGAGVGNITGAANIDLRGTTGNGGTLIALANNGAVTLGTVQTGSTSAVGGAVRIIAENGISLGAVTTTGNTTSGNVNLTVGVPTVGTGTNFQIIGGVIQGAGASTIGTSGASSGNLTLNGINAGGADVAITAGFAAGNTVTNSGLLAADELTLVTGASTSANFGTTSINTLHSTATGASTVSINNNKTFTLGTITVAAGQTLNAATTVGTVNHTTGTIGVGNLGVLNVSGQAFNFLGGTVGTAGQGTVNLSHATQFTSGTQALGTLAGLNVNLIQANSWTDAAVLTTGATAINATNLGIRVTGAGQNIGTSTASRLVLPAAITSINAISDQGSVFLGTLLPNTANFTLLGGSAGGTDGDFDFLGTGTTIISGDVGTTDGDINITTGINRITLNAGVAVIANGVGTGDGNVTFNILDTSKNAKKNSVITLSANSQVRGLADTAGAGNVTFQIGAAAVNPGKAPKSNVVTSPVPLINWGKGITANAPNNNLITKGAFINFNTLTKKNVVLGGGVTIEADPPIDAATQAMQAVAPQQVAVAAPVAPVEAPVAMNANHTLFGFDTNNSMVTSDLSVLNMNAAPHLQVANNATLMTASNAGSLVRTAGLSFGTTGATGTSGMTGVDGRSAAVQSNDDDNSYVVGYMGRGGETEAAICSDAEIGMTEGSGIEKVQHGDRVVIKKGNVLFVPFKATTVETPNGIVHIDAKAVALVSSTEAGLAVYDLEDQHKGSVSVESNGHNVVLSPGRHVMITKHHTAEFAQINAVETIAHRNVSSAVKNGHRAHTSEFSVLTALDTVKPLKALAMSKHAQAKSIADRLLKTTAIILQIGGAAGQYQHYFKPRMTAMGK